MLSKERLYGAADFDLLCHQASDNERLRLHKNIHSDYGDPCQRLFIAMQPGSYVPPHRHSNPAKSETFVVLQGRIGLIFFDDTGQMRSAVEVGPSANFVLCDIPPGVWHTAISLETDSVFLEVKPGPFCPISPTDLAPWAPSSGTVGTGEYLNSLCSQFKLASTKSGYNPINSTPGASKSQ
mgnify:CR=1 FL=1